MKWQIPVCTNKSQRAFFSLEIDIVNVISAQIHLIICNGGNKVYEAYLIVCDSWCLGSVWAALSVSPCWEQVAGVIGPQAGEDDLPAESTEHPESIFWDRSVSITDLMHVRKYRSAAGIKSCSLGTNWLTVTPYCVNCGGGCLLGKNFLKNCK